MSKHPSVAIRGDQLLVLIERACATSWRKLLGVSNDRLDELEQLPTWTAEQTNEYTDLDVIERARAMRHWWIVTWPDLVTVRRYNGDASYRWCDSEAAARAKADSVYGE